MAKVSYANLKLKTDTSVKTFEFLGQSIEVLNYLPIEDKYDLVMVALQKSEEDGIYNPVKLDMYFHLYLVYMYTNLSFTDKQKENEAKLFDTLKSNGFIDLMLENFNEEEYGTLYDYIETAGKDSLEYRNTAAYMISKIIQDLPKNAQYAVDMVNSFDKEKYAAVVDFARAANGGRDIATNTLTLPIN